MKAFPSITLDILFIVSIGKDTYVHIAQPSENGHIIRDLFRSLYGSCLLLGDLPCIFVANYSRTENLLNGKNSSILVHKKLAWFCHHCHLCNFFFPKLIKRYSIY